MRSSHPAVLLHHLACAIEEATLGEPGHVLVHVEEPLGPHAALALKPLTEGCHPFDALAGFRAPASWAAFGIRATGQAHHLDDHGAGPTTSAVTYLLHRGGAEASLLRREGRRTELTGPAVGTIPDLCRRVLALPTAPAPATTAELWTSCWLDRVLDAWGQPLRRRQIASSWGEIARLHPAAEPTATDPDQLVAAAADHAAIWSWAALRSSPHLIPLPHGQVAAHVAAWMDDGFLARWVLGAVPAVGTLTTDLRALLGEPLGPQLETTVAGMLN